MNYGLDGILGQQGVERFFAENWPSRPAWETDSLERSERFREVALLKDADSLMSHGGRFGVFMPDGRVLITEDPAVVRAEYASGNTFFVHGDHIPQLAAVRDRITSDLGLPGDAMRCEVFCSPNPSGAPMHSDYDINFAVLVHGTKTWRIAPNIHVDNPVSQIFVNSEMENRLAGRLARKTPLPKVMPADASEITFGSGGFLFLPRGWWHETRSSDECVQVNFAVKSPMVMTVFARAIRELVVTDPEWREYALDVFADGDRGTLALERIGRKLPELLSSLASLADGRAMSVVGKALLDLAGVKPVSTSE